VAYLDEKHMKKIFIGLIIIAIAGVMSPSVAKAAIVEGTLDSACEKSFMGLQPWYKGLAVKTNTTPPTCVIGTPLSDKIPLFVWTIVLNILGDLFTLVGYLSVGFLIYGGFSYALAKGSPDKIAKGKKIIMSAITGLIIAVLSTFIANTIVNIITEATEIP
jgi:hypothetical protein